MIKPRIKVVAAIITDKESRILVTQRPDGQHLAGYWEFPGGRIEDGESPQQALVREIKEELAVNIAVGDLLLRNEYEYDIKIIDIAFYNCKLKDDAQQIQAIDAADFRWINKDEFDSLTFPPADADVIQQLIH